MGEHLPFTPAKAKLVRVRPRRNFEGVYNPGYLQARTQLAYWRGTLEFAPFTTAAEIRTWREWIELYDGETISVSAYPFGWGADDSFMRFDIVANDGSGRRFAYGGIGPPAGSLLELKAGSGGVSVVSEVVAQGVLESYNPVLGYIAGLPAGSRPNIYGRWRRPQIDAIIVNSDMETIIQSSVVESRTAVIEWREARAAAISAYGDYPYVEDTPPVLITTEAGDPITTEAEIGIST